MNAETLPQPFEVFAIRYATLTGRAASENAIGADPHDRGTDLDYYIWVVRNDDATVVIDTGFGEQAARARGRQLLRRPAEGLRLLSIDPAKVEQVVITHLHYDHAGTLEDFPAAIFHIQDREIGFATGRCMCHPTLRHSYGVEDVVSMVRHVYAERVAFHDGECELRKGLWLHHVGGHTAGLQVVRVWTRRGWVVLASDASHLYQNMSERKPFPVVDSVSDMLAGHDTLRRLASSPDHIVPGHDPAVMTRYPPPFEAATGIIVRLDVDPVL
jgi:glyoxylase-like metal-dependent hydrolase (beta-lactamase superfamily II)